MRSYECDECGKTIDSVVYQLKVVHHTLVTTWLPQHFHWECLKAYMARQ